MPPLLAVDDTADKVRVTWHRTYCHQQIFYHYEIQNKSPSEELQHCFISTLAASSGSERGLPPKPRRSHRGAGSGVLQTALFPMDSGIANLRFPTCSWLLNRADLASFAFSHLRPPARQLSPVFSTTFRPRGAKWLIFVEHLGVGEYLREVSLLSPLFSTNHRDIPSFWGPLFLPCLAYAKID